MPSCNQICASVISSAAGGSPAAARNSSREKTASSATAGCVRWCEAMSAFNAVMISPAAAALSAKSETTLRTSATTTMRAFNPFAARKSASTRSCNDVSCA